METHVEIVETQWILGGNTVETRWKHCGYTVETPRGNTTWKYQVETQVKTMEIQQNFSRNTVIITENTLET